MQCKTFDNAMIFHLLQQGQMTEYHYTIPQVCVP